MSIHHRPMPYGLTLALIVSVIGCGSATDTQTKAKKARPAPGVILPVPDKLTLYSIDGTLENTKAAYHTSASEKFHGDPVLGKVEVIDPAGRAEIIRAFGAALQNDENWGECSWPRHAIRTELNGETTDYVICYQCNRVDISGPQGRSTKPTDRSSRSVLNKYLKRARVPLVSGAEG